MFFLALAADFDGTIAAHGAVEPETVRALGELKASGRRLVLVTGREVSDLRRAFPELQIFDRVVAENGGVVLDPASGDERAIAPTPHAALVHELMERKVEPISVGRTIIATWHPHEEAVLAAIQELGLDLHIIFNKGAVMVLPAHVTKASGLKHALAELGLSAPNVVAVGDAENDLAFLTACGCSAAVANALPSVKDACDIVLSADHGAGVVELIGRMTAEDIRLLPRARSGLLLGTDKAGQDVWLTPDETLIIAGGSGSGKTNFAILLTERMSARGFEFCVIDPEGDYAELENAVAVGDEETLSPVGQTITLLRDLGVNLVAGTLPVGLPERQGYFHSLLLPLSELRAGTGRPHWLIVDEAHHFAPRHGGPAFAGLPQPLSGSIFITPDPRWLAADIVRSADALMSFGGAAAGIVQAFAGEAGLSPPTMPAVAPDEALYWSRSSPGECRAIGVGSARQDHIRHKGKYAAGDVGERRSFHFRARTGDCAGRARNLGEFVAIAENLPEEIWERHLRAGDFGRWFLDVVRDDELARVAARAVQAAIDARDSRNRLCGAIRERYRIADRQGHG